MTPEQLREHAKQWDDEGRYSIGEVFRAHADALEELARLKAPVEGEIAAVCGMLDGYISNALPGIDTEIMRRSRAHIESLAFQYKEMEDAAIFNCEQSYKREAELTERAERAEAELAKAAAELPHRSGPIHERIAVYRKDYEYRIAKLKAHAADGHRLLTRVMAYIPTDCSLFDTIHTAVKAYRAAYPKE